MKILGILLISQLLAVSYNEDISPIIYNNCTVCHRTGEIGSNIPLTNYQEVYNYRFQIENAIQQIDDDDILNGVAGHSGSRHGNPTMPPWPADRDYSTFLGERYLADEEIELFNRWIDDGALPGSPEMEFPLLEFPQGSLIGEPDIVLSMSGSYTVEANGEEDIQCFIIPTQFEADMDVSLLEFRPGNKEIVHHAIIVAVPGGTADYLDEINPDYGYNCTWDFVVEDISGAIASYLPGQTPVKLKHGLGHSIPANSDLLVQIHYPEVMEDVEDSSSINVFFSDEPVDRYAYFQYLGDWFFSLPPDQITSLYTTINIPTAKSLITINPHCHLLGKSWEVWATPPNGIGNIPLIKIDEWDFDWQNVYYPEQLIHLPAGSTIHLLAEYDNTSDNPNNPNDPPQWVYPGFQTVDEMFEIDVQLVNYHEGDENLYLGNLPGDINLDDVINVIDIIIVIDFILETQIPTYYQFQYSDIIRDYEINVIDIIQIVNIILE